MVLATALLLAGLSAANPIVSFPINSQVPPVARIGEPFSFVFSPSTFSSSSPITYNLFQPPRWLSIDSSSRRLFGTPKKEDVPPASGAVVGVPLNLVATDDSGSTTLTVTLVVSRNPGPKLRIPLTNQTPGFLAFSRPSSFLSTPAEPFSFQLDPNTFSTPSENPISYYATMADNTPLPAWMAFDPSMLSFRGRTPPAESLIQPPQRFSFQLVASDVVGFAGASLGFDMIVGSHQLMAKETTVVVNATAGIPVSYSGLMDGLEVDGKPAAPETVAIASISILPPWLSVNQKTGEMSGVPPDGGLPTNFTVTLRDASPNALNLTVVVGVDTDKPGLFTEAVLKFAINLGEPFSFSLGPYLSNPKDTEVSFDADFSHPWIQFNASTTTLFGTAPKGLRDTAVNTKILAKSKTTNKSSSLSIGIAIRAISGRKGSTSADSTTGAAAPTESPSGQNSGAGDGVGNGRFNPMVFAVLLPLLVLLGLGVCALFWYFRRRKDNRKRPAISTRDISGPIPGTVVASTPGLGVSQSLPELTECFGKSFSADDIFSSGNSTQLDSRSVFLARPELPRHSTPVRQLSPSFSASPDVGDSWDDSRHVTVTGPPVTLRHGTRSKIRASLSSVTEKSIADLVDSRSIESVGNDRRSFRDKIEVNVPNLPDTPVLAHPGLPSRTDAMPSPQPNSSQTLPEPDAASARTESRHSYHPPAAATRKLSWPWLKGAKRGGRGSKLGLGMKRLSEQPSLLTLISLISDKTGQPSPIPSAAGEGNGNAVASPESSPMVFAQPPTPAGLSRPPTRGGLVSDSAVGDPGQDQLPSAADTTTNPVTPAHVPYTSTGDLALGFPIHGEAPGMSPDVYDGIIEHNPFRPSRTWSTVPTTDDWADETAESLALSRPTSQRQRNWTVLQESSPVAKPRESGASGMIQVASSLYQLAPVGGGEDGDRKGEGEAEGEVAREAEGESGVAPSPAPSRPWVVPRVDGGGDGKREISGLTRKSQSKGISLRSEGSRSDYAAFI